jgi:hypothetical protein
MVLVAILFNYHWYQAILAGTFTFYNDSVGLVTVVTNPTTYAPNIGDRTYDTVYLGASESASAAYVTSIVMQPGDTLSLVSQAGSDVWIPASGSAVLNAPIFRGIPSSVTPTFGSNSTSIATTAFVQQQGWEFPGSGFGFTTSQTLTIAQLNTWGQFQATSLTITLPLGSTVPAGYTFTFLGGSFGGTVQGNGTDIIRNATNIAANTFAVEIGQTVSLAFDTDAGGGWYVIAIGGASGDVTSFNTRTGAVTFEASDITGVGGALLASPAFTGIPTAPTATAGTDTTQLATTAFVTGAVTNVITTIESGSVMSFNARTGAITFEASDITDVGGALLASPAFTGIPTAPTATAGTDTTQLATTAFVTTAIANVEAGTVLSFNTRTGAVMLEASDITGVGGALLASPAFTGIPTAPTAAVGTNTTQLATTAFVNSAVAQPVGMSAVGNYRYWANQILLANQAGGIVYLTGTGGYTITLPTAASVTNYTGFILSNLSTNTVLLEAEGTDTIDDGATSSNTSGGATATSIMLAPGDNLFIMSDGMSTWHRAYWSNMISPTFYGVPTASTAAAGTNTTQLATTAFVAASKYYDVMGGVSGTITSGQLLLQYIGARTVTFPVGLTGSQGYVSIPATDSVTLTIAANGNSVGTIVFAAGSHTATFTASAAFTVSPGQLITVTAPATADATFANVSFTLLGIAS